LHTLSELLQHLEKDISWKDDNYVYFQIKENYPIHYSGMVYDFTMDGDPSFCTMCMAIHNSEIGRRFMPHRFRMVEPYNPIPNQFAGTWLPGNTYFRDFQTGDPMAEELSMGELRLPGEAYEKIHGMRMMQTRASSLGKSRDELVAEMLHVEEPISAHAEQIMEEGTEIHRKLQAKWKRLGILDAAELEIYDPELGISGHMDALLNLQGKQYATEIKSLSDERFDADKLYPSHLDQLNFYMHESGIHSGLMVYVNRDNPAEVRVTDVGYSPMRTLRTLRNVKQARAQVREMISTGEASRADLYDYTTRFEILSDIAPWSNEYRQLKSYLANNDQLTDSERERVAAARHRASVQKNRLELFPYRFRHANVEEESYTVKSILDANTILVNESEHPLRLAGVRASNQRITDYYGNPTDDKSPAELLFSQYGIRRGSKIRALVNADPLDRYANDLLLTQHAVVFAGGTNVNAALLESGVGTEKNEWTAAGVWARFTEAEIAKGARFEQISHLDTLINCIAPWTQVITSGGVKEARLLTTEDSILTSKGTYKPVVNVQTQPTGKHIVDIKIKSSNILITATEDHPILAVKHGRKLRIISHGTGKKLEPYGTDPKIEFIHAGQLESYDFVAFKPEVMEDSPTYTIDLAALNPERFSSNAEKVWVTCGTNGCAKRCLKDRYLTVTPQLARFLGYYAAEGCVSRGGNSTRLAYVIFTLHGDEISYIEDIKRLALSLGSTAVICTDPLSKAVHVRVGSCYLAEIANHFVGTQDNKHAPKELLTSNELRAEFVRGLLRGDGNKAGHSKYDFIGLVALNLLTWLRDVLYNLWKIPSAITLANDRTTSIFTNSKLLYGLTIGSWPELVEFVDGDCLYHKADATRSGRVLRNHVCVKDHILYRIDSVKESPYQGNTIDIEVQDDDTFATINADVHNTKFLKVRSPYEEYTRGQVFGKCVVAGTLIRTPNGIKPIEQIKVGESVLTHTGNWASVSEIISNPIESVEDGDGALTTIKAAWTFHEQTTTTNHQYLVVRPDNDVWESPTYKTYTQRWIPAKDIKPGDYVCIPLSKESENMLTFLAKVSTQPDETIWADNEYLYLQVKHTTNHTQENILVYDLVVDSEDHSFCTEMCVIHNSGGRWESFFSSYITPTVQSYAAKGAIGAGIGTAFFSSMFMRNRQLRGKAAVGGAIFGATVSIARQGLEGITGKPWIPSRTQKRRDIEEYYDILEYIKYRGLYESTASLAKKEEGTDVAALEDRARNLGNWRKEKIQQFTEARRNKLLEGGKGSEEEKILLDAIQDLKSRSEAHALGPIATQALLYQQKYRSTMYGASPSGPYMNIWLALPKYERELVAGFINDSTPEEREKIYRLLPDYEQRLLGNKMGIDEDRIPERKTLQEYFKEHTLPDEDWEGWNPDVDLEQLKTRTAVAEGLDPFDFGLYPQVVVEAQQETNEIPLPTVNGSSSDISNTLNSLLSGRGLKNLNVVVDVVPMPNASKDDLNINMKLRQDRMADLAAALAR